MISGRCLLQQVMFEEMSSSRGIDARSWQECSMHCRKNPTCEAWTFAEEDIKNQALRLKCHLLDVWPPTKVTQRGYSSGYKTCSGNICTHMNLLTGFLRNKNSRVLFTVVVHARGMEFRLQFRKYLFHYQRQMNYCFPGCAPDLPQTIETCREDLCPLFSLRGYCVEGDEIICMVNNCGGCKQMYYDAYNKKLTNCTKIG